VNDTELAEWTAASLTYLTETCGQAPWTDATSERATTMSTTRLTRDDELAEQAEEALTRLLLDTPLLPGITDEDGPVGADIIETYAEAGLLTGDKGLVVVLEDGRQLRLTITAYGPVKS
jgi:hypothetical protein